MALLLFSPLTAHANYTADFASALSFAQLGEYNPTNDALADKALLWTALLNDTTQTFSFDDYQSFIRANADFPSMNAMRVKAENVMPANLDDAAIIAWFNAYPADSGTQTGPQTGMGALRYAEALNRAGQRAKAQSVLRKSLAQQNFGGDALVKFQGSGMINAADFYARADRLLWQGDKDAARSLFSYLSPGYQSLIVARIALQNDEKKAAAAVSAVPQALQTDPGLLFDRVRYRRKQNDTDGAIALLAQQPKNPAQSEKWGLERSILMRRLMDAGDDQRAYNLAAAHHYTEGEAFAGNEFMAGWLALRHLNKPDVALKHFATLYNNGKSVITKARAAYWQGRAYQALGQNDQAATWMQNAAQYTTSYYGQIAARALGKEPRDFLKTEPQPAASAQAAFQNDERVRIAKLFYDNGIKDKAALFLRSLTQKAGAKTDYIMLANYASDMGMPQVAVTAAKEAAKKNMQLPMSGYPILNTGAVGENIPAPLAYAIIRQESQFDTQVTSKAGAMGLMQLMPGTATATANKMGITHDASMLIDNPEHNIRLGTSYLAQRMEQFNNSIPLAVAAYNGGAANVQKWIAQYGDPRDPKADMIDWIETIPFGETRNYVQRVIENTEVYRMKLGQ